MRDRLGMICGVGAVACLATLIVHWPRDYSVQRSSWEQQLFGDLVEVELTDEGAETVTDDSSAEGPSEPAAVADVEATFEAEKAPRLMTGPGADALLSAPIHARPADRRPRFVLPATHKEPAPTPSVWLSGEVEEPPDDLCEASRQPVTLYFAPQEPHRLKTPEDAE